MRDRIVIMIPALNPPDEFVCYVEELLKNNLKNIIVINDGSNEKFNSIFKAIEEKGVIIINHKNNLGKGRAIKDGLKYVEENMKENYFGVITVDSDGQHLVKDVINVAKTLKENQEALILGVRDFDTKNVPPKSKFGNKITSNCFKILYGAKISDTQTGLRGIPKNLLQQFINIRGERFEYETNMLIDCILKKIEIIEKPIETVYMNNNKETHFRPIRDSIAIYWRLLNSFIKYSLVSIASCFIDLICFQILLLSLPINNKTALIVVSTIMARIVSSVINYLLNKKITFGSKKTVKNTLFKYYSLCIV